MKIGIIIAMDSEYAQLLKLLNGNAVGKIGNNDITLVKCGIGKVNAALCTMRFIQEQHPDCIISTGVAGGIDAGLQVMDVLVASEITYHDVWCGDGTVRGQADGQPARFAAHPTLLQYATAMQLETIKQGLLCSGDQFITNHQELQVIKSNFPDGMAVDMESGAIAHTCNVLGVPFLCLRIISDTPGATSDHWKQYTDFWGSMANNSFTTIHRYLTSLPSAL